MKLKDALFPECRKRDVSRSYLLCVRVCVCGEWYRILNNVLLVIIIGCAANLMVWVCQPFTSAPLCKVKRSMGTG